MDWKEAQGNFPGGRNVLYLLEQWLHGINKYQNSNRAPKTCALYCMLIITLKRRPWTNESF